ncbi:amidase [Candidatus Villigracilis affinis]|uniref:amidase n=1 Tax=Candidatus Villigracilis affinis TaxID=3140682 RepID=UPI001DEE9FD2|nr:amidase [Anaerolineales bacterium]
MCSNSLSPNLNITSPVVGADMQEQTISELQKKMTSGELTSRQLTELFLERIDSVDRRGPKLNSVIETNPDALSIASTLDEERRAGKVRSQLHGIPILIKDNIDTRDRMQTTAGSLALEGHIAPRDAFIVKQLRKAGAIILGKTNLSEWANFRGRRSISGWSSRGGLTHNPYALDRSACGSSSGSGAATAANLCAAAVGTETDGSVICPAQTNGIVGIKPTLGLLSRSGIIPIAHSQDTAGPMARTVADAAILLGAMTGTDEKDPSTKRGSKHIVKDYSKFLDPNGLKGARIGVARNMCGTDARIIKIFEASIEAMKQQGAVIVDPANVLNFNKFGATEVDVLHYEFKADLNKYLAGSNSKLKTMAEIIKFNEENKTRVLQYFGQEHMLAAQEKGSLRDKKYREALAKNLLLTRKNGIDAALKKYKLDAIIVPSGGPAWMIDLANGDSTNWDMESTSPAAVAGYPHITVPAGYIFGLPVGISFFSTAWQEPTLIKLAYAFEQATKVRKPPQFLATAFGD